MVRMYQGFDKKTGQIKEVSEVPNGDACGLVCISCEGDLSACQGEIRPDYLRHQRDVECNWNPETPIHFLFKRAVSESDRIYIDNGEIFHYDSCRVEKYINDFEPDILASNSKGETWAIEGAFSSFVKKPKYEKIKKENINCVEYDLRGLPVDIVLAPYCLDNFPKLVCY